MLVSATWGLGSAIAQGEVVPDRYRLSRTGDVLEVAAGRKFHAVGCVHGTRPMARAEARDPCLGSGQIRELGDHLRAAEEVVEGPAEIEWCLDGEGIKLLQARPLNIETTASTVPAARAMHAPSGMPPTSDASAASSAPPSPGAPSVSGSSPSSGAPSLPVMPALSGAPSVTAVSADEVWEQHPRLRGHPGGVGWGTGRACVVNCECELSRVHPGDILVTQVAGPALADVLPRVAGVVAELGGSTSHLASLARERGLPMVLGVLDATGEIPEGSTVAVDGVAGIVRWMD